MTEASKRTRDFSVVINSSPKVWIIDKHPLMRTGLRFQLEDSGFCISFEGASVEDALTNANSSVSPELVLLNFNEGLVAIASLRMKHAHANIIVMGDKAEIRSLSQAFAAGADGYLLTSISAKALVESCKLAILGEKVVPCIAHDFIATLGSQVGTKNSHHMNVGNVLLSEREIEIVKSIAGGLTNKSIAKKLGVTEASIKVQLKTILRKLGVHNRTQVAIWAHQNQLTPENCSSPARLALPAAASKTFAQ